MRHDRRGVLAVFFVLLVVSACRDTASVGHGSTAGYDPSRDPAADLAAAVDTARQSGRRILLEVGGEWCSWCHLLEKFLHSDEQVQASLNANFVVVKVNYSEENKNQEFLSRYPEISGYPHLFVLESDGTFLHSQETGELEQGKGYDRSKVLAFFEAWAPVEPKAET